MPPNRNISTGPGKPLKTERTHEENQERAYIAASRRSDRSLEARVESARRASEIHKKRTGRGLRVTEQDVLDEEMYEEEDDEIPIQVRLMTQHWASMNAGMNPMFNQKIQNYLAQQMGTRNPQFNPAFFGNPQLANNQSMNPVNMQSTMFGGPMFSDPAQYLQQQQQAQLQMNQIQLMQQSQAQAQNQQSMQPQSPRNASYRQAPYSTQSPRQQQQGFQPSHSRSQSTAIPHHATDLSSSQNSPGELSSNFRRNSDPVGPPAKRIKTEPSTSSSTESSTSVSPSRQLKKRPSFEKGAFASLRTPFSQNLAQPQIENPFSTALPAASQQMMGYVNDDMMSASFAGASDIGFSSYANFSETGKTQHQTSYPSHEGLNSTLAPPSSQEPANETQDFSSDNFFNDAYNANNGYGSLNGTPGLYNDTFDSLFDINAYEAPAPKQ